MRINKRILHLCNPFAALLTGPQSFKNLTVYPTLSFILLPPATGVFI